MQIYGINFSNNKYWSSVHEGEEALLIAITSIQPANNKFQILEMCERAKTNQITKISEVIEPYPATKIQWLPDPGEADFFATSSDVLRLYRMAQDQPNGVMLVHEFNNVSEFCGPLTSFDWNRYDRNCIATSSLDNTVTIWDL